MGARVAFNKPTDERRYPVQVVGPRVNGSDENLSQDVVSMPRFGLLDLSAEDRKLRWMVLGFGPLLEAVAVGIMLWALMSLPPGGFQSKGPHRLSARLSKR